MQISDDMPLFAGLVADELSAGRSVRFVARGGSMTPVIRSGDIVTVAPIVAGDRLLPGDIVLYRRDNGTCLLHRLGRQVKSNGLVLAGVHGDSGMDELVPFERIIGRMVSLERGGQAVDFNGILSRLAGLSRVFMRVALKRASACLKPGCCPRG